MHLVLGVRGVVWVAVVCLLLPALLLADPVLRVEGSTERNTEATLGQLPYLISIWKEWTSFDNTTHTNFHCTGTLVHNEYVLTSLSCAEGATRGDGRVLAAGGHLSIADDPTDIEFHVMAGYIPHEEYDPFSRVNNIALIKVTPPFVPSANIQVVSVRSTIPAENTECTISGWREDYFETSAVLKTAQVRVLAKPECRSIWEEDEKYPQQLCAGIPKSESAVCNVGDEGGPLLCEFALAGIYADNDIAVCISGLGDPNAYLDASVFSEWVTTSIGQGITPSTTTPTTTRTTATSTETVTTTTTDVTTTTEEPESSTEATLGQLPYLISIWKEWTSFDNTTHTNFHCTGTLVHNEYVLTSLSCAEGAARGDGRVLAAGGHLSIADDPTDIEFHEMIGWILHEEYDSFSRVNNIALIKVSPPFVPSANIQVASVRSTIPGENTECTISGWREDYFETSTVLKTAQVRVLAKPECKFIWEEDEKYPQQLCAGIPKSEGSFCNVGDEGGPLLCEFALAGIYADNNIGVCISGLGEPNAYLDASVFSEWVSTNLEQAITTSITTTSTTPTSTVAESKSTAPVTTSTGGAESSPNATLGQVPYLISVWKEWKGVGGIMHTNFDCTGTLVHPEYVLTSRTCAEGVSRGDGRVLLAGGHLSIAEDPTDVEFHEMSEWIEHEEYDMSSGVNNIALIKVATPFVESDNIQVASVLSTLAAENTQCTVSGWRENYFETSTVLKTAQVRVLAKPECKYLWEEDEKYPQQLCAGIPKSEGSVCNVGDEGGPLLCGTALAGLYVNNQIAVCISGEPNGYLDTSVFSEWVANKVSQGTTASTPDSTTDSTTTEEVSSSTEGVTSTTSSMVNDHTTGVVYHSGSSQITAFFGTFLLIALACLTRRL